MAISYWAQDKFTAGELSPLMYSRVTVKSYFDAMKQAKNVFTLPQGAATKRFGTTFLNQVLTETNYLNVNFQTWQYLDECTYIVVIRPGFIDYYLETTLQETLPTILAEDEIREIDHTVLDARFRITTGLREPFDMVRTNVDTKLVTGFTANTLEIASAVLVIGRVTPVIFSGGVSPLSVPVITFGVTYFSRAITTTSFAVYANVADANADANRNAITNAGTSASAAFQYSAVTTANTATTLLIVEEMLTIGDVSAIRFTTPAPVTTPQVRFERTYFSRATSLTEFAVYETAIEAEADTNRYAIASFGTAGSVVFYNKFTLTEVAFQNIPVFDFGEVDYDANTFKPAAVSGNTTITATTNVFTAAHIGGSYVGNGGVARIIGLTTAKIVTVSVTSPFTDIVITQGVNVVLTEPAWSAARGWPKKCSSYQSRAIFANTEVLPNGLWLSVINGYADFNDLETDDDSAISWYPTSGAVNVIKFIVPYRSLTIHTNSGVFSTPLLQDAAITPKNFSLSLQDSTPATNVQPRSIDNQIIVLSGNDAHSLIFDGVNNAYTTSMISVMNEQVLRNPISEADFRDFSQAGSRYMFVVNEDGSLAIYQTLITEEVSGWTTAVLEQSYGLAKFRAVSSNFDGRFWFMNERQLAEISANVALTANTADTLTAIGSNFEIQTVTAFKFIGNALPAGTPEVSTDTYYWAVGIDADEFYVYLTTADALADENRIAFTSFGVTAFVQPWPLVTRLEIEQLSVSGVVDGAGIYSGTATSTLTGAARFNAQDVKILGDGFGFQAQGIDDEILVAAHGSPVEVVLAEYGFPIELIIEPLPLSINLGQTPQTTDLARPKHVRKASFMFNDTVGGTINGVPIAVNNFTQAAIGFPPTPMEGLFDVAVMKGWDEFKAPTFTITHNEPFNFRLLGIFYVLEI